MSVCLLVVAIECEQVVKVRSIVETLGCEIATPADASTPFGFRSPWLLSALAAPPTREGLHVGQRPIDTLLQDLEPALTGERLIYHSPQAHE